MDSLRRSLLGKREVINSQLKETQKHERKLVKRFQRRQRLRNNELTGQASVFIIQYKEETDKLMRIQAQLRERLSTIELKLAEIKRSQIV